jgi:predicted acylesterase/phospholipase RssA
MSPRIEPDWIIGTSIGAVNASLIAGNEAPNRLPRLEFKCRHFSCPAET